MAGSRRFRGDAIVARRELPAITMLQRLSIGASWATLFRRGSFAVVVVLARFSPCERT